MNSKIYFKNDSVDIPNFNLLIEMAYIVVKNGYEINELKTEGYDINITFFKDDFDGSVNYENGGKLSIEVSNPYECINLFNEITDKVFTSKLS